MDEGNHYYDDPREYNPYADLDELELTEDDAFWERLVEELDEALEDEENEAMAALKQWLDE